METDNIAVSIRKARLFAGLTQKQVADAIDKSQTTVAAWETGRSQPDAKTIILLSELFHVSSDFLLGISSFHNKSSEAFLGALLGESPDSLTQSTRNTLSKFTSDLISFCNLFNEIDIELLPYAIESLTAVLHILEDLMTTYGKYQHTYSVYRASENLLSVFNSMSDEEQKKTLSSHEEFSEILNECSNLCKLMESFSPTEFSGEALRKIEKASDSIAVFALHLYAEISLIDDPLDNPDQDDLKE